MVVRYAMQIQTIVPCTPDWWSMLSTAFVANTEVHVWLHCVCLWHPWELHIFTGGSKMVQGHVVCTLELAGGP